MAIPGGPLRRFASTFRTVAHQAGASKTAAHNTERREWLVILPDNHGVVRIEMIMFKIDADVLAA